MAPGPDAGAMKKGEEMGKSVAKPIARFIRPADPGPLWPPPLAMASTPFFNVSVKGKTSKFEVVAGETTTANGSVVFTIRKWTNGISTVMKSFTLGVWLANTPISVGTDEIDVADGDVFTIEATNLGVLLPSLMIVVTIEVG